MCEFFFHLILNGVRSFKYVSAETKSLASTICSGALGKPGGALWGTAGGRTTQDWKGE